MRTIVELPDEQITGLKTYCDREGVSRAEAVRRAVEGLLMKTTQEERERLLAETFGSWKQYGVDTDAYLAEIRGV